MRSVVQCRIQGLVRCSSPEAAASPGIDVEDAIEADGYRNWIRAVAGHGASHGNWWNGTVWSECRAMASGYFSEIGTTLEPVAVPARELSGAYREIADLLSKAADKELEPVGKAALLTEAKDKETRAITQVESLLASLS